jgi:hypothetical protein
MELLYQAVSHLNKSNSSEAEKGPVALPVKLE